MPPRTRAPCPTKAVPLFRESAKSRQPARAPGASLGEIAIFNIDKAASGTVALLHVSHTGITSYPMHRSSGM